MKALSDVVECLLSSSELTAVIILLPFYSRNTSQWAVGVQ